MGPDGTARLRKICLYGSYVTAAVLVFIAFMTILFAVGTIIALEDPDSTFSDLDHSETLYTFSVGVVGLLFCFAAGLMLLRLTRFLSKGPTPFTAENVRILKALAVFVFLAQFVMIGLRYGIAAWLDLDISIDVQLSNFLLAAALYVIALIFQYGAELQEDADSIV